MRRRLTLELTAALVIAPFFPPLLPSLPGGAAAGDARAGEQLFRTCAGCHNTQTAERKMGPSLRSLFGKVTLRNGKRADDENVRAIVLDGYNGMPAFRYSFRPAEIDDLMAYLHTLSTKPPAPATSPGEAYFRAFCIRCHDAQSRTSTGPGLHGRLRPESIRRVEEGHADAPPLREWLDDAARRQLFEYLKTY
jgi:cytochrome c